MTTKEQGIQALMEDHGLTEDAARAVAAAVVDGLTEFLKKRFVGDPITLTTAKDVATACTEFYKTEVYDDIVDAIISYKRKGAGVALTDDQLKAFIKAARQRAAPVGPLHALWDLIFDAEALLVGGQTLLSCEQIERQIRLWRY